ncbi:MAG: hypothetical protein EOO39_24705 [Cytophagaceae bacterium]|nr:MAG: hypothetical protein EOO39_24705 [Cytophagaceae bacterium]
MTFTTACQSIAAFPWNENFDAMTAIGSGVFPSVCWKSTGSYASQNAASQSSNDPRSAPNYVVAPYTSSEAYLYTPGFSLTAGVSYDFSFWWAGDGTSGWRGTVFVNNAQNETGQTNLGTFVVPSVTTTSAYTQATRSFTPETSGTYYFAIRSIATTFSPNYLGFDDFSLSLTPVSVASFTPATVCQGGGTAVTITGAAFTGATSVTFNGVAAQSFTVVNSTTITAVAPAGVSTGVISVTTPAGSASSANSFQVTPSPVVNAVTGDSAIVCVGGSTTYATTSPGGTWSSSNTAVATVTSGGVVTGVAAGTANIIYSVTDLGCTGTASKSVSVESPIVSTQPLSQTVVTGTDVTFTVSASGAIASYMWQVSNDGGDSFTDLENSAPYSGVTTATLTIDDATADLSGSLYRIVITPTGPCDIFESDSATLLVGNTGIAVDPQPVTLCSLGNGIAEFTVTAAGQATSYRWQIFPGGGSQWLPIQDGSFGNLSFSGSETSNLMVSGITLANSGSQFRAIAQGVANSATSNGALLTVNEGAVIVNGPVSASNCYSGGTSTFSVVATAATA